MCHTINFPPPPLPSPPVVVVIVLRLRGNCGVSLGTSERLIVVIINLNYYLQIMVHKRRKGKQHNK